MPLSFCAAGTTRALSAADAPEDADFALLVSITDGLLVFEVGGVGAASPAFGAADFAAGFAGVAATFLESFFRSALRGAFAAGLVDCFPAAAGTALRAGATGFFATGVFFATTGRLTFAAALLAAFAAGLTVFAAFAFATGFARTAAFTGFADFARTTVLAGFALAGLLLGLRHIRTTLSRRGVL